MHFRAVCIEILVICAWTAWLTSVPVWGCPRAQQMLGAAESECYLSVACCSSGAWPSWRGCGQVHLGVALAMLKLVATHVNRDGKKKVVMPGASTCVTFWYLDWWNSFIPLSHLNLSLDDDCVHYVAPSVGTHCLCCGQHRTTLTGQLPPWNVKHTATFRSVLKRPPEYSISHSNSDAADCLNSFKGGQGS